MVGKDAFPIHSIADYPIPSLGLVKGYGEFSNIMEIIQYLNMAIAILGIASMYTPRFKLQREDCLTRDEIQTKYPELDQITSRFRTNYFVYSLVVFVFMYILMSQTWTNRVLVAGCATASIGLYIGSIAWKKQVSLYPERRPTFLFAVGEDARQSGRFQVIWSLSVIAGAIVLDILMRIL